MNHSDKITRPIDELGRFSLPKKYRNQLNLHEGDQIEIFVEEEGIIKLKKYSPVRSLALIAKQYADSLHNALPKHIILITDTEQVVSTAGFTAEAFLNSPLSLHILNSIKSRKPLQFTDTEIDNLCISVTENFEHVSATIFPIIVQGDVVGTVVICIQNLPLHQSEMELILAQTAAGFLAKQMEY